MKNWKAIEKFETLNFFRKKKHLNQWKNFQNLKTWKTIKDLKKPLMIWTDFKDLNSLERPKIL
jgi:hypothetical protein